MHLNTDPWRRAMVAEQIRMMGGPAEITRQTEYWEVTKDTLAAGPWPTARRGWLASIRAPHATHHVLMQDDAVLCKDFLPGLKAALAEVPPAVVSLFTIHKAVQQARERGDSWIEQPDDMWGVAVVLPSAWVTEFVRWTDANVPAGYLHDERRVSLWMMEHKRLCLSPVPSLVEHGGAVRSTLGHNDARCVASWFIGQEASALNVDWSRGALHPLRATTQYTLRKRWSDVAIATNRNSRRTQAREAAFRNRLVMGRG
jgi:hypothetical protein